MALDPKNAFSALWLLSSDVPLSDYSQAMLNELASFDNFIKNKEDEDESIWVGLYSQRQDLIYDTDEIDWCLGDHDGNWFLKISSDIKIQHLLKSE